ncbi:MAG: YggS family pyridoxal phosphate-dependent enzyme [Vicinamibacterales bacterium]
MSPLEGDIRDRLERIRSRIAAAALRVGRDPLGVRLVAVSKTFSPEHVLAAAAAGQTHFGENRVQEALPKMEALAGHGLTWHLVGHLQSNKVRKAVAFDSIQSIDSADLLARLDRAAWAEGRPIEALIQVDLAGEATKHGVPSERLEPVFEAAAACRAVRVTGLMLLPPFFEDPEGARPFFRKLAATREALRGRVPDAMLAELSMGMSHDFEVAIEEGATTVRIGTAIFGSRQ